ncbi:MAG: tetratricopeptide repeat protein [Gemmataceae bacterium]
MKQDCGRLLRVGVMLLAIGGLAALAGYRFYSQTSPRHQYEEARKAIANSDMALASLIEDSLFRNGDQAYADLVYAERHLALGDPKRALAKLPDPGADENLRLDAAGVAGRGFLGLGNLQEAERAFAFVRSKRPNDLDSVRGLVAVYYDLGAWPRAVEFARSWSELDPTDGRPHRLKGMIRKELSQFELAIEEYQTAIKKDLKPHVRQEAREELAECLIGLQRFSDALKLVDETPDEFRADPWFLPARGECLLGLGLSSAAAEEASKAIMVAKPSAAAYLLYGRLLLEQGKAEEAIPVLAKAAEASPRSFRPHHLLSQAYSQVGKTSESKIHREQVAEIQSLMDRLTQLTKDLLDQPHDGARRREMAALYDRMRMPEMAERSRRLAVIADARSKN